jgi:hypothetical protein
VLLVTAGMLQLALGFAFGLPWPAHIGALAVGFLFTAFAFMGLGMAIAMLVDNVPAVQALGQCIFLPMLILGGVAVQLESLPLWAQHVSVFLPGRYAVEVLQRAFTGTGLGGSCRRHVPLGPKLLAQQSVAGGRVWHVAGRRWGGRAARPSGDQRAGGCPAGRDPTRLCAGGKAVNRRLARHH